MSAPLPLLPLPTPLMPDGNDFVMVGGGGTTGNIVTISESVVPAGDEEV